MSGKNVGCVEKTDKYMNGSRCGGVLNLILCKRPLKKNGNKERTSPTNLWCETSYEEIKKE